MSQITLPNGTSINSKDITRGLLTEAGANSGMGPKGAPQDTSSQDHLVIQMKDKVETVTGPDALRVADELDAAEVAVFRRARKKATPA